MNETLDLLEKALAQAVEAIVEENHGKADASLTLMFALAHAARCGIEPPPLESVA